MLASLQLKCEATGLLEEVQYSVCSIYFPDLYSSALSHEKNNSFRFCFDGIYYVL